MIGTYAAVLAVCGSSLAIGAAAMALCGARRWSWLSPAVGLALLCAICWATVRMPGDGAVSAAVVGGASVAAALFLRGRVEGVGEALGVGGPVALGALLAASLPFLVEGHFGILGTGFNPDMSQHLLATDRLAAGEGSQLLDQGYPLGPHAIVVALNEGLGIGPVQGFGGLTLAVAVLAPLTALSAFTGLGPAWRTAAALVVGLSYLVASYFAQGAFKETAQALFVLAFVLALRESTRPEWRELPLRFVPAALVAVGSVYTYSFPGVVWLAGTAAVWGAMEMAWARYTSPAAATGGGVSVQARRPVFRPTDPPSEAHTSGEKPSARTGTPSPVAGPAGLRAMSLAIFVFAVGVLPELGRMTDFQRFETFDPDGPGLGNLFGQVSPFTALGIWFSGDFRVAAGDGAAPAFAYYLGAAFAATLLAYGLLRCVRRRETAILAGALAVAGVYLAARIGGTPYTAAKALGVAAPVLTLAVLAPLLGSEKSASAPAKRPWSRAALALYLAAGAACSLLAFANAPVGPTSYSPALTGLRPLVAADATLVLAPERLLAEEHGERYVLWELRGGRVCVGAAGTVDRPPPGVRFVVAWEPAEEPPFPGFVLRRDAGPYRLWEARRVAAVPSPCPPIPVRQARR